MSFDFALSASEEQFREEVRAFVGEHLPPEMARRNLDAVHSTREDMLGWTRILAKRGWSVPHWPAEYGGTGWTLRELHIFQEELFAAGAPPLNMQATSLVGPVIHTFGSDAQKARFLAPIRNGEVFWAQGFSEPNAGSDLASLKTRAVRDGDDYVINGQKIWTSQAHIADWLFLLVRTNPEAENKRAGISFVLAPADAEGITIRPITSIDGGVSLCEVFLEDVRVPMANLVGEEGKGWTYANFLLGNERTTTAEVPRNKRALARLKELARTRSRGGRRLIEDPVFAGRIAELELGIAALEVSVQRVLGEPAGSGGGRPTASTLKLRGTEILQGLLEMQVEALGSYGAVSLPVEPGEERGELLGLPALVGANHVTGEYLYRRAATIYGGTSEIQRTIIAKAILRLDDAGGPSGALSDDERMIADSVRRFAERSYGFEDRRKRLAAGDAALRATWKSYAEMGWLAMGLSERSGGLGSPPEDIAIVLEGLGGALAVEPFLSGALLAPRAIEAAAGAEQAAELLGPVAAGAVILALAHEEPEAHGVVAHVGTRAEKTRTGYVLNGRKAVVLGAPLADTLIVSARTGGETTDRDGITLFAVAPETPGLTMVAYELVDGRRAADVALADVTVVEGAVVGRPGGAFPALCSAYEHAIIGLCAEAVGAMERALWITRDYVKTRRQFNSALADFQAVQHRLADMYTEVEQARSMLLRGLATLRQPEAESRSLAISATKAQVGRSGRKVGAGALQLHGGIGVTDEYVIGHYFKRLMVCDILFGDAAFHLRRVAAAL